MANYERLGTETVATFKHRDFTYLRLNIGQH